MSTADFPSTPAHQPLRWWNAAQLREIAHPIERAWRDWLAAWSAARAETGAVSCELAWDEGGLADQAPKQFGSRAGAQAWFAVSGEFNEAVAASLFDDAAAGPGRPRTTRAALASAIAAEAAEDLLGAICGSLGLDRSVQDVQLDANIFRPWSGAVVVSVGWGQATPLRLLLDGNTAARLVAQPATGSSRRQAPREELTAVKDACAGRRVSLQVSLSPCELELGALRSLQIGDIVPLPHRLDAPLQVTLAGDRVCQAFLGKRRDAVAVELIRDPSVSQYQASA